MCAKRVTSQDVADHAGVSRTTVSLVLSSHATVKISKNTRERVIKAAQELGYVPDAAAQALASRRSRIIGLILTRSLHHIAADTFMTQLLDGILEVIHQNDMRLVVDIIEPEHQKECYLEMVRAKRIDGILLSGPRVDDQALEALQKYDIPTVLIGQLPGANFPYVDVDNRAAARKAVSHLVGLGHEKIALITNAPLLYTASIDRLNGYKDVLQQAGIRYQDELLRFGEFNAESGYEQMMDLIQSGPEFSAAFVASDMVAIGARAALSEKGISIPDDVALVGFDDLPFAKFEEPPLTTIRVPAQNLGKQACQVLIDVLDGTVARPTSILLETSLVIRQSCGANKNYRKKHDLEGGD